MNQGISHDFVFADMPHPKKMVFSISPVLRGNGISISGYPIFTGALFVPFVSPQLSYICSVSRIGRGEG